MTTFWAAVLVFGVLIFFHELGHFAVAKAAGIRVYEFSLGFGPKLVGLSRSGTVYNLRLLPLGGFVRMAGMDPEDKEAEEGQRFGDKSIPSRMAVIAAGPLMNFVLAWLLFVIVLLLSGSVQIPVIKEVLPGTPAEQVGLRAGDEIVSIEGEEVKGWRDTVFKIQGRAEQETAIVVLRNGEQLTFSVVPELLQDEQRGAIGIRADTQAVTPLFALKYGFVTVVQMTSDILHFIGQMITGQEKPGLGGPVRIVHEIDRGVEMGLVYLLQLAAFLSINLGLFNLFPIPALDGSRLVFLGIEGLRGRPVEPARENFIHLVGFGLLMLLIVFVTYNDVLQLLTNNVPSP